MKTTWRCIVRLATAAAIAALLAPLTACAQAHGVDFESDRWTMRNARLVDHLGRRCLIGMAYLEDVEFENGVITVDIAVDGRRSYPGFLLRMQSEENYEHVYVRPHRAGLYSDAVQYTPVINGISCWQLFNGEGCTAAVELPENEWITMRIEVAGRQARVYVGEPAVPVLVVTGLGHGESGGSIGVSGPLDGSAHFSNFSYEVRDDLAFPPPPPVDSPPGLVTDWEMSQSFRFGGVEFDGYPGDDLLDTIRWQAVRCEHNGLVNVAWNHGRSGMEPDVVFARTTLMADHAEVREMQFGYSDAISVFIDGEIVFTGNSAYRSRDPSFLGIIGFNDAVHLPLKEGKNELLIMVAEAFGGWGFMFRDGKAVFLHRDVGAVWESAHDFSTPESAVYDPARKVVYVSNYDMYRRDDTQFISKMTADGKMVELHWVDGIANPTGMALAGDRLYVVERRSVVEIDVNTAEVVGRHAVPQPGFINDIAIDRSGAVYVSDSGRSVIFRYDGTRWEEWVSGGEIGQPNGICIQGERLIVGNNADRSLKAIDLSSKEITTVARLGVGTIDGLTPDGDGRLLVSHWEGRLYRVDPSGGIEKLLDTSVPSYNIADFGYRADDGTVFIPTFSDDRVTAYRVR
ncbi:MAG TPA: SMP-30/gluconolactonase/LRE family protein [Patescibacteria group bacterium]|nr:SMP-30/gluconolactonase/LRE family protein [Patescibacteria group bacterium]